MVHRTSFSLFLRCIKVSLFETRAMVLPGAIDTDVNLSNRHPHTHVPILVRNFSKHVQRNLDISIYTLMF